MFRATKLADVLLTRCNLMFLSIAKLSYKTVTTDSNVQASTTTPRKKNTLKDDADWKSPWTLAPMFGGSVD